MIIYYKSRDKARQGAKRLKRKATDFGPKAKRRWGVVIQSNA